MQDQQDPTELKSVEVVEEELADSDDGAWEPSNLSGEEKGSDQEGSDTSSSAEEESDGEAEGAAQKGFDRFDSFPDIVRLAAAVSADEGGLGGLQPLFDEEELELDSLESSDNSSSFDSSEDEGEAGNGEEEPSKDGYDQNKQQVPEAVPNGNTGAATGQQAPAPPPSGTTSLRPPAAGLSQQVLKQAPDLGVSRLIPAPPSAPPPQPMQETVQLPEPAPAAPVFQHPPGSFMAQLMGDSEDLLPDIGPGVAGAPWQVGGSWPTQVPLAGATPAPAGPMQLGAQPAVDTAAPLGGNNMEQTPMAAGAPPASGIVYRTRARCDLRDVPIEDLERALGEDWVDEPVLWDTGADEMNEYERFLRVLRGEEADGFPDDLEDDDQDFAAALESWGFKGDEDTWTLQGLIEEPDEGALGAEASNAGAESVPARRRRTRQGRRGAAAGEAAEVWRKRVLPDRQARARAAAILRSAAQAAAQTASGPQLAPEQVRALYWQVHIHTQLLFQLHMLTAKDPAEKAQAMATKAMAMLKELDGMRVAAVAVRTAAGAPPFKPEALGMLQGPAPGVHESPKGTGPTLASAKAASAAASSGGGKGKSTKAAPKDQQDQAAEPAQQPPWCPATLTDVRSVLDVAPLRLLPDYTKGADAIGMMQNSAIKELEELASQDAKGRKQKRKRAAMGPVQRTWVSVAQPLVQTLFKAHFDPTLYYQPGPTVPKHYWSPGEDQLLAAGITRFGTDWKAISAVYLPTKNPNQVWVRQKNLLARRKGSTVPTAKSKVVGPLTAEELAKVAEGLAALAPHFPDQDVQALSSMAQGLAAAGGAARSRRTQKQQEVAATLAATASNVAAVSGVLRGPGAGGAPRPALLQPQGDDVVPAQGQHAPGQAPDTSQEGATEAPGAAAGVLGSPARQALPAYSGGAGASPGTAAAAAAAAAVAAWAAQSPSRMALYAPVLQQQQQLGAPLPMFPAKHTSQQEGLWEALCSEYLPHRNPDVLYRLWQEVAVGAGWTKAQEIAAEVAASAAQQGAGSHVAGQVGSLGQGAPGSAGPSKAGGAATAGTSAGVAAVATDHTATSAQGDENASSLQHAGGQLAHTGVSSGAQLEHPPDRRPLAPLPPQPQSPDQQSQAAASGAQPASAAQPADVPSATQQAAAASPSAPGSAPQGPITGPQDISAMLASHVSDLQRMQAYREKVAALQRERAARIKAEVAARIAQVEGASEQGDEQSEEEAEPKPRKKSNKRKRPADKTAEEDGSDEKGEGAADGTQAGQAAGATRSRKPRSRGKQVSKRQATASSSEGEGQEEEDAEQPAADDAERPAKRRKRQKQAQTKPDTSHGVQVKVGGDKGVAPPARRIPQRQRTVPQQQKPHHQGHHAAQEVGEGVSYEELGASSDSEATESLINRPGNNDDRHQLEQDTGASLAAPEAPAETGARRAARQRAARGGRVRHTLNQPGEPINYSAPVDPELFKPLQPKWRRRGKAAEGEGTAGASPHQATRSAAAAAAAVVASLGEQGHPVLPASAALAPSPHRPTRQAAGKQSPEADANAHSGDPPAATPSHHTRARQQAVHEQHHQHDHLEDTPPSRGRNTPEHLTPVRQQTTPGPSGPTPRRSQRQRRLSFGGDDPGASSRSWELDKLCAVAAAAAEDEQRAELEGRRTPHLVDGTGSVPEHQGVQEDGQAGVQLHQEQHGMGPSHTEEPPQELQLNLRPEPQLPPLSKKSSPAAKTSRLRTSSSVGKGGLQQANAVLAGALGPSLRQAQQHKLPAHKADQGPQQDLAGLQQQRVARPRRAPHHLPPLQHAAHLQPVSDNLLDPAPPAAVAARARKRSSSDGGGQGRGRGRHGGSSRGGRGPASHRNSSEDGHQQEQAAGPEVNPSRSLAAADAMDLPTTGGPQQLPGIELPPSYPYQQPLLGGTAGELFNVAGLLNPGSQSMGALLERMYGEAGISLLGATNLGASMFPSIGVDPTIPPGMFPATAFAGLSGAVHPAHAGAMASAAAAAAYSQAAAAAGAGHAGAEVPLSNALLANMYEQGALTQHAIAAGLLPSPGLYPPAAVSMLLSPARAHLQLQQAAMMGGSPAARLLQLSGMGPVPSGPGAVPSFIPALQTVVSPPLAAAAEVSPGASQGEGMPLAEAEGGVSAHRHPSADMPAPQPGLAQHAHEPLPAQQHPSRAAQPAAAASLQAPGASPRAALGPTTFTGLLAHINKERPAQPAPSTSQLQHVVAQPITEHHQDSGRGHAAQQEESVPATELVVEELDVSDDDDDDDDDMEEHVYNNEDHGNPMASQLQQDDIHTHTQRADVAEQQEQQEQQQQQSPQPALAHGTSRDPQGRAAEHAGHADTSNPEASRVPAGAPSLTPPAVPAAAAPGVQQARVWRREEDQIIMTTVLLKGDDAETFTQLVEELNSKFNSSSQQALTADAVQARYRHLAAQALRLMLSVAGGGA